MEHYGTKILKGLKRVKPNLNVLELNDTLELLYSIGFKTWEGVLNSLLEEKIDILTIEELLNKLEFTRRCGYDETPREFIQKETYRIRPVGQRNYYLVELEEF